MEIQILLSAIVRYLLIGLTMYYAVSILYLLTGLFSLSKPANSKKHNLSIIIAAHNEEKNIARCLDCLVVQDYPRDRYEIIVADDRSIDGTASIVHKYCEQFPFIRSVSVSSEEEMVVPKKTALRKGLDSARGEIIVGTDADCTMTPSWLTAINSYFTNNIGMVIGHTAYPKPDSLGKGIDALDYLSQRALGVAFIGVGSAYTCTASNFAYRKSIYDKNREQFALLKVRPAEDNYFLHCVHADPVLSVAVAADYDSVVTTSGAENFRHFLQQRFRWGAYGGNITTTGVKMFFIPFLLYYLVIWMAGGLTLFMRGFEGMLGISLCIKLFVDALFMVRATTLYRCPYLLLYFLPLSIVHILITPIIVIKGNLFTFEWKGRKYTKEKEIVKH